MLLSACAYSSHHIPELREDPGAAAVVEVAADQWCQAMDYPAGPPTRPFTTDGCSCWPDGSWQECCILNDIAYWCGGTPEMRALADRGLRRCVAEKQSAFLGGLMQVGLWIGGHPWWPTPWRWNYGHDWRTDYYLLEPESDLELEPESDLEREPESEVEAESGPAPTME